LIFIKNIIHNIKLNETVIEFNDNNIEHVLAGPDYGQPWGDWNGWEEIGDWFEENVPVVV